MKCIELEAYEFFWNIVDLRVAVFHAWSKVDSHDLSELRGDVFNEYLELLPSLSRLSKKLTLKPDERRVLTERLKRELAAAWESVEKACDHYAASLDGGPEEFGLDPAVVESPHKDPIWNQVVGTTREFCSALPTSLNTLGQLGLSLSLAGAGGCFYGGDFDRQAALLVPDKDWLIRELQHLRNTKGLKKLDPYPDGDSFEHVPDDFKWADANHEILLAHFESIPYEPDATDSLPWDEETEDRNRWIYLELCRGTTLKDIISEVSKEAEEGKWEAIGTPGGIKAAAERYAKVHGLSVPEKRKAGRPPAKKRSGAARK